MGQALDLALYSGPPSSVALGFFDGYHRGHRAIVAQACRTDLAPLVFTFSNHPAAVIDSRRTPKLISTFRERVDHLLSSGATVVWSAFDRPFSQLEPEAFVRTILVERLGARRVVVGSNYRYGHRAAGTVESLRASGRELGFEVTVVEAVEEGGEPISSTRIRALLEAGEMRRACDLLGAPFSISSVVSRGDARGRQLGFPTANLPLPPGKLTPPYGVYAVQALQGGRRRPGVANLGVRPTLDSPGEAVLEVHLLDHQADLYGHLLEVHFLQFLRPERKFSGLEELKNQIGLDVQAARQALGVTEHA